MTTDLPRRNPDGTLTIYRLTTDPDGSKPHGVDVVRPTDPDYPAWDRYLRASGR